MPFNRADDNTGAGTLHREYRFVDQDFGKADPATGVHLDDLVLVYTDESDSGLWSLVAGPSTTSRSGD